MYFLCRYNERTNLEVKLFDIQMKYRGSKQKTWHPPEGKLISDVNKEWINLEGAEHEREAALRKELIRFGMGNFKIEVQCVWKQ